MDLVEEAGIDVAPWAIRNDGGTVENPRANPAYCYEWAFGGDDEPTALCVWHNSLREAGGVVSFEENLRQFALSLDRIAIDNTNPTKVRSRARDQAKRARKFDSLLQRAYRKSRPVRVVILLGEQRPREELGWDTSTVRFRSLDAVSWYVHAYADDDGSFRLVRGVVPASESGASASPELPTYVDQYSIPEALKKSESTVSGFDRDQNVRQAVLRRAAGVCECCAEPGFRMASGAIYLETHHVIPLSEGGPDIEWNLVAICPNDHRRAHYGEDRAMLCDRLVTLLSEKYPAAEHALSTLRTNAFLESAAT